MNDKILKIYDLKRMSTDVLIEAVRNGYKIEEFNSNKLIKGLSSCPSSIQQGTSKLLTITPSSGTPPYTLEFIVDGIVQSSFPNVTAAQNFNFIFNQSVGAHTYNARLTDSCPSGAKVVSDTPCTINITASCGQTPSVILNIPL